MTGEVAVQTDGVHPYDADGEPTPIHRGLAASSKEWSHGHAETNGVVEADIDSDLSDEGPEVDRESHGAQGLSLD